MKKIEGKKYLEFSKEGMKFASDTQLSEEDVSFKADWYRWKKQRQSERIKSEVYKYNGIWVILKKNNTPVHFSLSSEL